MEPLPRRTGCVIVGAGFAGAATAWALGVRGLGPGIVFEQEAGYGQHASGKNAALLRIAEHDEIVRTLAMRSAARIAELERQAGETLVRRSGGLTLAGPAGMDEVRAQHDAFRHTGPDTELLRAPEARRRFPLLDAVTFDAALWCPSEGVVDIHALLTLFLRLARERGFQLRINCRVEGLLFENGRVAGVRTSLGDVQADVVVDAGGAWAGRADGGTRLPVRALRRHLFVCGAPPGGHRDSAYAWMEDDPFYFRPEGDGLLFSACDETEMPPGDPPTDPAALDLLAQKLARWAPAFVDLPVRRSWACLRTFAPDRHPIIGADRDVPGLFHVSALGGFGMTCSAAIGELAAALIAEDRVDWIDSAAVSSGRFGSSIS